MKKLIMSLLLASLILTACGASNQLDQMGKDLEAGLAKIDAGIEEGGQAIESLGESLDVSGDMSQEELAKIVDELTMITAEKYGSTKEAYLAMLEKDGKKAVDEFTLAAGQLGLSLKDYLAYEKENIATMSDEQKETMQGMGQALEALGNVDTKAIAEQAAAIEGLMETQGEGDLRIVSGDIKALGLLDVKTIEMETDNGDNYECEYVSTKSYDEALAYFLALLTDTSEFMSMVGPTQSTIIGTIEEAYVTVMLADDGAGSKVYYNYIDYNGDGGKK